MHLENINDDMIRKKISGDMPCYCVHTSMSIERRRTTDTNLLTNEESKDTWMTCTCLDNIKRGQMPSPSRMLLP